MKAKNKSTAGKNNSNWRGGRSTTLQGYVYLFAPNHPYRNKDNQVAEHRLIIESVLGRHLKPTETTHHVNEIRDDNNKSNLVACENNAYHMLLHQRLRAYRACGDPNRRFCRWCGGYDNLGDFYINGKVAYHKSCNATNQREYKKSKVLQWA